MYNLGVDDYNIIIAFGVNSENSYCVHGRRKRHAADDHQ